MQHYYDNVTLPNGYVVPGASVLVQSNGVAAALYSDNGVTPKANPLTTDATGSFDFYAANGTYTVVVTPRSGSATQAYATLFDVNDVNATAIGFSQLAASTGSSLIGFIQSGTGAVARTAQAKARERVSPEDYGAVGDGVADDSIPVHKCFDYCIANGKAVRALLRYRVTSGYVNATDYKDLRFEGESSPRENVAQGSTFILDSTDPASFFYKVTGRSHTQASNVAFMCAQFVQDREFFQFASAFCPQTFFNVDFRNVEKPIVWKAGAYFQSSAYTNTQFSSSGMFYSQSGGALIATLLVLNNVNKEGSTPTNTDKIVCDLSGVFKIQSTNFLIEGSLPSAGWTSLRLRDQAADAWSLEAIAEFHGLWIEWGGAFNHAVSIYQTGGVVKITQPGQWASVAAKYKLDNKACVVLEGVSFAGTSDKVRDYFDIADAFCRVILNDGAARNPDFTDPAISYSNVAYNPGAGTQTHFVSTRASNSGSTEIYKYRGGYVVSPGNLAVANGTTVTPQTDATYGRKLVAVPSAGVISVLLTTPVYGVLKAGDQLWFIGTVRLPVITAGLIGVTFQGAVSGPNYLAAWDSTYSSQVVHFACPYRLEADPAANIGALFTTTASGAGGNMEILAFEMALGDTMPRRTFPNYPQFITTYAAAVPASGSWTATDQVINSAPAVGQPKAWKRITTGSGNVLNTDWVSEGNL